jgi:hypothetical protein
MIIRLPYDYFKAPGRLAVVAIACISLAIQAVADLSRCYMKYSDHAVPLVVMPVFFLFIAYSLIGFGRLGKVWWYAVMPVVTVLELGAWLLAPRIWLLGCVVG